MARFVEIEARPLLAASLSLALGISSASHPFNAAFLGILLGITIRRIPTAIAVALAFLVGLILGPIPTAAVRVDTGPWQGEGQVITVPNINPQGETCILRAQDLLLELSAKGHTDLTLGQTLYATGTIRALHGETAERLGLQGVAAELSCNSSDVAIVRSGPALLEFSTSLRNSFLETSESTLPMAEGGTVGSMVFGSSGVRFSQAERNNLSRSGAIHVLSVSGLQVFLLAGLLQLIFSWIPVKRVFPVVLVGSLLVVYACATGLHPSTVRAAIVVWLALAAFLFRRQPDLLSALGVAAILTLLWQPWTVYTPGFQMSYLVVAALALFWKPFWSPKSNHLLDRVARWVWVAARTSLIASLAVAPLVAYHYGFIPLLSPVSALLIAPAQPFVIVFSLIGWGLAPVAPELSHFVFGYLVSPLASYIGFVSNLIGGVSWGSIDVPPFSGYWLAPYYAAWALLWNGFRRS